MMHNRRRWCVSAVATAEELAEKLTQHTWTLCTGFFVPTHPHYLFLNDATHEDGAGEFGVVAGGMDGPHIQIESITFSWCTMSTNWPSSQLALTLSFCFTPSLASISAGRELSESSSFTSVLSYPGAIRKEA